MAKKKEKIEEKKTIELEDVKEVEDAVKKEESNLMVPLEEYIKAGVHLGTKVVSGSMKPYIYKKRGDGLAIINTNLTDQKIKEIAELLAKYDAKDIILTGKREACWHSLEKFSEATGIRVFPRKYPAGILTNLNLEGFIEPSVVFVVDPWLDKNAIKDAKNTKKLLIALCDSNNETKDIDFLIPCNNKSNKSIGLVTWILAREYCAKNKKDFKYSIESFIEKV